MTTFNQRDWWDPSGWFESPKRNRPENLNREVTLRWTMAVAFCVWIASLAPGHLFAGALAGLLFLAGLASMALACLQGHDPAREAPNGLGRGLVVTDHQHRTAGVANVTATSDVITGCGFAEDIMKVITSAAFALFALGAQAFAQAGADKMIVPGERIGPASLTMSLDLLLQALGPKQAVGRPSNGQLVLQQSETADAQASAVHRFDHLGLRAVTPVGNDNVRLIAAYNSADTDHAYRTEEGIKIGSTRSEVEAAYGAPTATTIPSPIEKQMIYDTRGLGLRLTADDKVDLIQVFRPGAARERWKF